MSTEFFDKDTLKNLPPLERAKIIQKKKQELSQKLEEEATNLEEESKQELKTQQKELDLIIESESELKKNAAADEKSRNESLLEATIINSPEAEIKHESVEYGAHSVLDNQYVSGPSGSNPDAASPYSKNHSKSVVPSDSKIQFKEDGLGDRFYSDKPKKDYL